MIRCIRKLADENCRFCLNSCSREATTKPGADTPYDMSGDCGRDCRGAGENSEKYNTNSRESDENKLSIRIRRLLAKGGNTEGYPSSEDILEILEGVQDSIYPLNGYK